MEYQKDYLRRVGREGLEIIDSFYGPPRYPRLQTHPVLQVPSSNFTTNVYQVQPKVFVGKALVHPSKDVAFSDNGRQNAYQMPQTAKPKEPVTREICKVPQVPTGNGGILTSDQAAKTYGEFARKEYYW